MNAGFIDITGQRFGMLVATENHYCKKERTYWTCICDCGNVVDVNRANLIKRNKSCGCLWKKRMAIGNKKHGLSKHPLNKVWNGIIGRCYDVTDHNYYKYGGRGVVVCDEWRYDFVPFYNWALENGWKRGLQVDKDIKGSGMLYSPETCLVVTSLENSRHTRSTIYIDYKGDTKPLWEWCEILYMDYKRTYHRLKKGKSFDFCVRNKDIIREGYNDHSAATPDQAISPRTFW